MDWINKIEIIISKLEEFGYFESIDKINDAKMILGTPGEMYMEVLTILLNIKNKNGDEYKLISKEIEELISYGNSINYI